jgi:peptidoglycan/LPS O-acetylase OafA/YrhL
LQSRSKRIPELEAVRGIAAVVVLVHHFMVGFAPRLDGLLYPEQPFSLMGTPAFALINGSAAVIVFFVLSGYVLTAGIFQRNDPYGGALALAKRWPRLAGPVIIASTFAGVVMALGRFVSPETAKHVPSIWLGWFYNWRAGWADIPRAIVEGSTTFFSGSARYNSNLWTMYYEFLGSFVAIGCATALLLLRKTAAQFATIVVVWAVCFCWGAYVSAFVIGVWLAQIYSRSPKLNLSGSPLILLAIISVLLLGYHENLTSGRAEGIYAFLNPITTRNPIQLRVLLHTIGAALVMIIVHQSVPTRKLLAGRVGTSLGYLSFAIYLTQIIVICSISSSTFDALADWPHVTKLAITFLVTAVGTVMLALPLAALDGWWLKFLNGTITRIMSERRIAAALGRFGWKQV